MKFAATHVFKFWKKQLKYIKTVIKMWILKRFADEKGCFMEKTSFLWVVIEQWNPALWLVDP